MINKRDVELVVISDVHLGTAGCHAKELLQYLKSINPKTLVLNGDIIDMWQFKKSYWPKSHMRIIKHIIDLSTKATKVYYITGNHDEMLRKFAVLKLGKLEIINKLVLKLDGKTAMFFHGDVFDVIMQNSKWLAKLGAIGYDFLIQLNVIVNSFNSLFGIKKVSLSKQIKSSVKSAVKFINNFEQCAIDLADRKGYNYMVCGHIHHPEIIRNMGQKGNLTYLNSGDWIENLTALEYHNKTWKLYRYSADQFSHLPAVANDENLASLVDIENNKVIFSRILEEIQA